MGHLYSCINSGVNTNMMLEAFHRKLKVCYFHHKKKLRVDSLLNRLSRDLIFECLIKSERGKLTYRIDQINVKGQSILSMQEYNQHIHS